MCLNILNDRWRENIPARKHILYLCITILLLNHIWGQSSGLFGAMSPPRGAVWDFQSTRLFVFSRNTKTSCSSSLNFRYGRLETCCRLCTEHVISQQLCMSFCKNHMGYCCMWCVAGTFALDFTNCCLFPLCIFTTVIASIVKAPCWFLQLNVWADLYKCPAALNHTSEGQLKNKKSQLPSHTFEAEYVNRGQRRSASLSLLYLLTSLCSRLPLQQNTVWGNNRVASDKLGTVDFVPHHSRSIDKSSSSKCFNIRLLKSLWTLNKFLYFCINLT